MLDQNLFRENSETPDHPLLKQFQIASDVANDLLDNDSSDNCSSKDRSTDLSWTQ